MTRPSRSRDRAPGRRAVGAVGVAVVLGALVLSGCGIPAGSAKPIARADVPFHLLDPGTAPTTTTGPPAVGVAETVYLVGQDQQHLVAVERDVPVPAGLPDVVGALLAGPTSAEQASGISSFVSGNRTQVSTSVTGGVATVNFSVNPVQVVGPEQTIAVAQVVYTLTQQPGVNQVLFHIGGQPVQVPVANGTQASGPVNRFDYLPQYPL